ncbi:MAG: hypothetical protein HY744_09385 [Deltaproteobacteria bacterium]|nr:hypothetical protein [Deltaproteobacteria bacterium]
MGTLPLATAGCGRSEAPPETVLVDAAEPTPRPRPPVPPPEPEPSASAEAAGHAPAGPPASIDGCCSALRAVATEADDAANKARASQAAQICASIAGLVRAGKTSRARALVQIRAAAGSAAPSACR